VTDTFPRQYARTQRLTLGEPRTITVSPDGRRVVFVRSRGGNDPVGCLWVLDLDAVTGAGVERLVADPLVLLSGEDDAELPPAERARRERTRESAGGVVAYATNTAVTVAAFTLSGRLFVAGLLTGAARELPVEGPVFDARPDPTASRLAYVAGPTLRLAELDGTSRELVSEPGISWGSAEFVAAEEMGRTRGYWWAPDGSAIVAARVDVTPVARWWISDPAHPEIAPSETAYPAAGTANADVTLWVLGLDGRRREIWWDHGALPYLADVQWPEPDRIVLTVQSRDQRQLQVLSADPTAGDGDGTGDIPTTILFEDTDEAWVELVAGAPAVLDDGRVVMTAEHEGARRLVTSSMPITPPDLVVRDIVAVVNRTLLFTANPIDDPTSVGVWRFSDGATTEPLVTEPGVHTAWAGGKTVVVRSATLGGERTVTRVLGGPELANLAEEALVRPNVTILRAGARAIAAAVLLPRGHDGPLPVLLDPYGGPHAQRVLTARSAYYSSQWFADQGFAVLIADGRGTPGRGSDWERAVRHDLAGPVLEDQIEALQAVAERYPELDLSRVAIRGWSFGGYLAALAVLRRPDVFHAAIAGAPVTDWRLYDTHYTERYLGSPHDEPEAYERTSLIAEVARSADPVRPLLLIHGLADDNVVVAHTLQLSSALLAAGRPHRVLPLSGVTHMTPQEVVAENLMRLQLAFLREALGLS
jgi:dipeptidyl-peptidase 4